MSHVELRGIRDKKIDQGLDLCGLHLGRDVVASGVLSCHEPPRWVNSMCRPGEVHVPLVSRDSSEERTGGVEPLVDRLLGLDHGKRPDGGRRSGLEGVGEHSESGED